MCIRDRWWCGPGGIEFWLGRPSSSFSAVTLFVGSFDLWKLLLIAKRLLVKTVSAIAYNVLCGTLNFNLYLHVAATGRLNDDIESGLQAIVKNISSGSVKVNENIGWLYEKRLSFLIRLNFGISTNLDKFLKWQEAFRLIL